MACSNGEQVTPKGETGIFFICKLTGNACVFVKWCTKSNCFIMATDSKGNSCSNAK